MERSPPKPGPPADRPPTGARRNAKPASPPRSGRNLRRRKAQSRARQDAGDDTERGQPPADKDERGERLTLWLRRPGQ